MTFSSLTVTPEQQYQQDIQKRGLSDQDVKDLGLHLLSPDKTCSLLGHTKQWAFQIPYFGLDGKVTDFSRVRLLNPPGKMKYSQRKASGSHIYFPPTINWQSALSNVSIPLIITEGELKSWAILQAIKKEGSPAYPVGLAGVTSWGGKKTPLHEDLMRFKFQQKSGLSTTHRDAYILFDYDGKGEEGEPNEQVAIAEMQLAIALKGLGAQVHLCRVGKYGPGAGKKYAIDDHLLSGKALSDVIVTAEKLETVNQNDLKTQLYEFRTQYAFYNGDVIRLDDGHVMSYGKAKIDSGHIRNMQVDGKGKTTFTDIIDHYKAWTKKLNLTAIDVVPEYQGLTITPDGRYNLLKDWEYQPVEGDVALWLSYCAYFFRDLPDFEDFFHSWVAQIIQKPWQKNLTTVIFSSPLEGIGKSAIAEIIARMMGVSTGMPAGICGPDEIFKEKNEVLAGKLMLVVNEPSSDREDHQKTLKHIVTSDYINIDKKYGAKYTTRNFVNLILTTNSFYVTKMGKDSRREAVYSPHSLDRNEARAKYGELKKWLEEEDGYGKILNWYQIRDISNFDPAQEAPQTQHKDTATKMSQTGIEDFADELMDYACTDLECVMVLTASALKMISENAGAENYRPKALKHAFSRIGVYETKVLRDKSGVHRHIVLAKKGTDISNLDLKKHRDLTDIFLQKLLLSN